MLSTVLGSLWWQAVIAKRDTKGDIASMLRPYWIKTSKPLGPGYGITARSEEDAQTLLDLVLYSDYSVMAIEPINDASSLDQKHVIPNMGNMLRRGIWYPLGYGQLTD